MVPTALEPLWPGPAPGALGEEAIDRPGFSVHLPPSGEGCGTGVLVCPGGGYRSLAADHEGLQVARWLNRLGIAAFVLRYRLGPRYHSRVSRQDAQRALRLIRHRADAYRISGRRLGMLGFSAGGHLTVACGVHHDPGDLEAADPVERQSCRPDFLVPVYAVVNGVVRGRKADEYEPTDTLVRADTPPTFLMHTHEDAVVSAEQSLLFYRACLAAGVQAEMHIFGHGEHGVGLALGDPDVKAWPGLLHAWLRRCGLLTDKPRIAVSGRLLRGGEAPGMAWISLLPEDPCAPPARIRISRDSEGVFHIPAAQGPAAGPHRIEVHWIADQHPYGPASDYSLPDARSHGFRAQLHAGISLDLRID